MSPKRVQAKTAKPRRRRVSLLPRPAHSSAERAQTRREAGDLLFRASLSLFGVCKLNAMDFCRLMYFCYLAEVPGANFQKYAYPPDKPSGRYQSFIDTLLPGPGPYYELPTPIWGRGASREVVSVLAPFIYIANGPGVHSPVPRAAVYGFRQAPSFAPSRLRADIV